jgi:Cu2+-exporting ATPase
VGYNSVAIPIAAGVFAPWLGLVLRPEIAALSMSGSTLIVTVNAMMLKRLSLPTQRPSNIGSAAVSAAPGITNFPDRDHDDDRVGPDQPTSTTPDR